ncbi:hypothetical protein ABZP36_034903 [Zizania latifolia]
MGGVALDAYGVPLPDETLTVAKASYAVLLGAIGGQQFSGFPWQQFMVAIILVVFFIKDAVVRFFSPYLNTANLQLEQIKLLFAAERQLCDQVFECPQSMRDKCFAAITKNSLATLLSFGEAIAMSKRSPEKLFVLLDMYEIICELQADVGSPKTHRRFLARNDGTYGPMPRGKPKGLLAMPFNTTSIDGPYCVGDNCFLGQGVIDVAFSGIMCAHRVAADISTFRFY